MKIVEARCDLGVHINGSNLGPKVLMKDYNYKTIIVNKKNIKKELDKNNKKKNINYLNKFNERLYKEIIGINDKVLTIGGDHSVAIASSLASKKKHGNIGLIWIDSHADFHNMNSTISGNIHGMPFATITGQNGNMLSYFFDGEYFKGTSSCLVGGRDIESAEYINLDKAKVKIFTTEDIKKENPTTIMEKAFEIALKNTEGVHISFDIDVIDPIIAKGVSVKAKDGITDKEAYEIVEVLKKHKDKIKSIDLVEFNPKEDKDKKTIIIAKKIFEELLKC